LADKTDGLRCRHNRTDNAQHDRPRDRQMCMQ
jgi:hypothetical protein